MSVRDNPVLWLNARKAGSGATALGGNTVLATPAHHLDGPEHLTADDTTTLDATVTEHGLLPKLSGDATDALLGDGTWGPPVAIGDFLTKIEGGQDTIKAHGSMGSTETIDPTDGNVHTGTLNAACAITLNAPVGSGAATLELYFTQDGTGGWAVTWPGSVTFPAGTTPVTTAGTTTRYVLETLDGGTTWYGNIVGGGSGSALTVKDEGTNLDTAVTSIDAVGAGVTATAVGHAVTLTIPGTTTADIQAAAPPHAHVVGEAHLSNGSGTTYTLDEYFEPGTVIAWNVTSLARLGVTETAPDQATVSPAGSSGDTIMFDYATPVV